MSNTIRRVCVGNLAPGSTSKTLPGPAYVQQPRSRQIARRGGRGHLRTLARGCGRTPLCGSQKPECNFFSWSAPSGRAGRLAGNGPGASALTVRTATPMMLVPDISIFTGGRDGEGRWQNKLPPKKEKKAGNRRRIIPAPSWRGHRSERSADTGTHAALCSMAFGRPGGRAAGRPGGLWSEVGCGGDAIL